VGIGGLTTLVVAVSAAMTPAQIQLPPLPKVQVPPPKVEVPALPLVQLPPLQQLPVTPPRVTPVPTAVPTVAVPPTTIPTVTTATAAPAATPAPPTPTPTRAPTAAPRRRTTPTARRRPTTATPPRHGHVLRLRAAVRPVTHVVSGPAATPSQRAPKRRTATPPEATTQGIAGDVIDLVDALPPALLWSLLGIAAIALGLAGNAYHQSRQRTALEAQRRSLIDDIGLLSQALLPPVPQLDGLTVSAAYRPADGPAAGGDFYDVFALDEHRVGVLLGDVSGHGRDSVTLAALARYTLRTLLAAGLGPGEALARADRMLERDMRPRFATVIAGVYDRRTTRLTYAKAGHAPPIVVGAAHDTTAQTPACPIGAGVGESWPEYHVDLAEGVSVCLVTDGLEEAKRDGTRLGRTEVERLVAAQGTPDAQRLLRDVDALADHVSDDTAAVVLARG
jgi:stage II sporulation SpoE-like protein